ncbi:hypothetical protein EAI_16345 [Harpegnathos saltator]|uniref:RRM domain-containing protein n=1 Tax=Harpegnathos saltator TaxID=610380 RepID=E2BX48_HARSA|nr:hypothetical protein EAI_16345 [Harpegnathos saltator]
MMSEHDDTLLDEDLEGDEEYDLGNDEEEALLADDYEVERQNSYKGEEETDDVLDLGVTDALDDLDGEDENIEFSRGNTDKPSDNDFYKDEEHSKVQTTYYEQDENAEYANEQACQSDCNPDCISVSIPNNTGDLREKLQKNMQVYVGNGQGLEEDDCEEAKERRNRFQNERTMISPKMNNDIPDTLENVVTSEPSARTPFRGRGRGGGGRIARGRGGRFNMPNTGNFNPRFGNGTRPGGFDNQPPACRPPLLETRPLCLLSTPNSLPNQPLMYQQASPQKPFQQFGPNGPMQQTPTQFVDNRPQFNPGQFQGPIRSRVNMGPRLEYGPPRASGPLVGGGTMPGPGYNNCPPNQPPFHPMQPFQNPGGLMQENQMRPMHQGNQGPPLLQGNPGNSLLGNPNVLLTGGNPLPLLPSVNIPLPMQQGFPRQQAPPPQPPPPPPPPPPSSSHGLPSMQQQNLPSMQQQNLPSMQQQSLPSMQQQNLPSMQQQNLPSMQQQNLPQMPSQQPPPPYENRLPFQETQQFQGRNAYNGRAGYPDQVPNSQFNNSMQPPVPQQSTSNVHSVSLPPGHKILINPHFRGAVQPTNNARLVWDTNQQVQQPQVSHSRQFPQQPASTYQNQSYNQSQQATSQYKNNYLQSKSDDPYAYFSDVWQENRPQKPQNMNTSKQYVSNNYSRDNSYSDNNKYRGDSQRDQKNNYQEDHRGSHPNYRERDLPLRARNDHMRRSRSPTNTYRGDSYDQNHSQKSFRPMNITVHREPNRPPQKRIPESTDRPPREISPKRSKSTNSRNFHEIRRVDIVERTVTERKEEDIDPEMQEYCKKMEEQKRLREKLLREKENRRKMAAMEKQQNEDGKMDPTVAANEIVQQDTKAVSALMGVVKDNVTVKVRPGVGKGRGRPVNSQSTEATDRPLTRIVRAIPTTVQANNSMTRNDITGAKDDNFERAVDKTDDVVQTRQMVQQSGTRRVVIHKSLLNSKKVATTIQKTVSNLQRSQGLQQKASNTQVVQVQKIVQNPGNALQKSTLAAGQKTAGQTNLGPRMGAHKALSGLQKTVVNVLERDGTSGGHLQRNVNAPNSQRIVLQTSNAAQPKKLPENRSNVVRLDNLAMSTSEAQIRRMCQGIGTIESIRMGEGNATVVFKTQSAAMVFHKKYQHKMLDLSLINVRFVPQTTSNKVVTATAKKS